MTLHVAQRVQRLAPSQIRENMRLASEVGAINLAQGRPDFPAADEVKRAAIDAILEDQNQYSVTWGLPELRGAISQMLDERFGLESDPETEVTVTCGVTEAMVATILATVDVGDEVVIIEPAHENYLPATVFAGGVPKAVALQPPDFQLEAGALDAAMSDRTRLVIVNTPHNPSGRVFGEAELRIVAEAAERYDALVLTDEIYDRLVYGDATHVCPKTIPRLSQRTVVTGGISKIHAVTGWRLGYVVAEAELSAAIRTVHDFLTICAPTPFQHAAVRAMKMPEDYYEGMRRDFSRRRDVFVAALREAGFVPHVPEGAYYTLASYDAWGFDGDNAGFVRHLIEDAGVAVVGGPAFYPGHPRIGEKLVRFAFAKELSTLERAGEQLRQSFRRYKAGRR